ncbi:hypothetical protein RCO28_05860 [Streptomyces sp. LHD-70]|uniref:hypothetical protein n=1 Tax=Streptomyces sp. LHD-70 TaxID=3072140 RepID=UPI0028107B7B|nr:hypothetical protein [Streptomyces sp. LHD-70]MDQ8702016.1 hypothetical protein [Streptomyces sp. LHD-70]
MYAKQGGLEGPFAGPVAWEDPGTPAAWSRSVAGQTAKFVGWWALWWGVLYVTVVVLPEWAAIPAALVLCVIAYNAVMSGDRLGKFRRMRRILMTYPWLRQPGGVQYDPRGRKAQFRLPDPDKPEKSVSPKLSGLFLRPWDRIARKGVDGIVYAGDPRFACVIAEPGPRSLSYVSQPTAYNRRTSPRRKGLSPEARRRARAIGARVTD